MLLTLSGGLVDWSGSAQPTFFLPTLQGGPEIKKLQDLANYAKGEYKFEIPELNLKRIAGFWQGMSVSRQCPGSSNACNSYETLPIVSVRVSVCVCACMSVCFCVCVLSLP